MSAVAMIIGCRERLQKGSDAQRLAKKQARRCREQQVRTNCADGPVGTGFHLVFEIIHSLGGCEWMSKYSRSLQNNPDH